MNSDKEFSQKSTSTNSMPEDTCARCGDNFRVELCIVSEPEAGIDRDRVEAHLCYDCRQEVTHEPLGATSEE
jgi:hypothetical protein